MTDHPTTSSGSMLGRALPASAVADLSAGFAGALIQPGDPDYDRARAVFNGMIDRRPALIARCTGPADVVAAVRFARDQQLLVAVRAGGHSVPGYGTCDGGIVIDVAPMKGIWVNPEAGVARAQAGLLWGEFDRETQLFGLATTGGRRTSTGVAGQTLGSGSGWLERKFGLTCRSAWWCSNQRAGPSAGSARPTAPSAAGTARTPSMSSRSGRTPPSPRPTSPGPVR